MEGQLSNVIPEQKSSCPMRLLLRPHHSPAPPYPVLHPPSFTVWFPRSHLKSPCRLLFSKEFQVQYAFVTSFFKRIITKISKSLNSLKIGHVSTSDFFLEDSVNWHWQKNVMFCSTMAKLTGHQNSCRAVNLVEIKFIKLFLSVIIYFGQLSNYLKCMPLKFKYAISISSFLATVLWTALVKKNLAFKHTVNCSCQN